MLCTALCLILTMQVLAAPRAEAQGVIPVVGVEQMVPPGPLAEDDRDRLRLRFSAMSAPDLSLTYARIYTTFREVLTHQDLGAARTLVDYASVADGEMRRRHIARPPETESPRAMLLLYELVL